MNSSKVNVLIFEDLQKAWEGINEYLFLDEARIISMGGGDFGSMLVSFNNMVIIKNAHVDPEFDFGRKLGYSKMKWTTLVNNYCDYQYLDMLRTEVNRRESTKSRMYNYTLHFSNKFGSGKDCLISLTISRRPTNPKPILTFNIRTSEVTKRLLFDFLLVQRICEYIYGHNEAEVHLQAQHFYITAESMVMYTNIKPLGRLYKNRHGDTKKLNFQEKIFRRLREYSTHPDPSSVMFKVNRRSMMQIQKDEDGNPLSGVVSLKAKSLVLMETISLPKEVITRAQVLKYKKTLNK